jgi:hypothetical protein
MDLVRQIMERAVSSVYFALPAAKLCITIIEVRHRLGLVLNIVTLFYIYDLCDTIYQFLTISARAILFSS